jgi:hypothetical protein
MTQERSRSRFVEMGARSKMPYEARLKRFNLMLAMRSGVPPYDRKLSLRQVADELVRLGYERIGRERVRQLVKEGPPIPRHGAGVSLARRRGDLERRVERWRSRGTTRGDARAEEYRRRLKALGSWSEENQATGTPTAGSEGDELPAQAG